MGSWMSSSWDGDSWHEQMQIIEFFNSSTMWQVSSHDGTWTQALLNVVGILFKTVDIVFTAFTAERPLGVLGSHFARHEIVVCLVIQRWLCQCHCRWRNDIDLSCPCNAVTVFEDFKSLSLSHALCLTGNDKQTGLQFSGGSWGNLWWDRRESCFSPMLIYCMISTSFVFGPVLYFDILPWHTVKSY